MSPVRRGMGNVIDIAALGCGEFNVAYKVTFDKGLPYALKIAPAEGSKVLTYEKNMMKKVTALSWSSCPEV